MPASTTASKKSKGRRHQQDVAAKITATFPELEEGDVRSVPSGVTGADIMLSPKARTFFNFNVECKNVESLNVWKAFEQAKQDRNEGATPLLVFKRNRSEVLCCLKFDDFLNLIVKK